MPDQVITGSVERLFQYGILGILVIVFGWVIGYLYREWSKERKELLASRDEERRKYEEHRAHEHAAYMQAIERLQQLRIDDAKSYQAQLVDLTKQATTSMTNIAQLLGQNKEALIEVRDTMREIGDDIRRRP